MADENKSVVSVRLPAALREQYEKWAASYTPAISESELMRGVLAWAIVHRPDWQPDPQRDWEACTHPPSMLSAIPSKTNTTIDRLLFRIFSEAVKPYLHIEDMRDPALVATADSVDRYSMGMPWGPDPIMAIADAHRAATNAMVTLAKNTDKSVDDLATLAKHRRVGWFAMLARHGIHPVIASLPLEFATIKVGTPTNDKRDRFIAVEAEERKKLCDMIRAKFPLVPAGFEDLSHQYGDSRTSQPVDR